ncbi:hypothetical protein WN944_012599 [Citrus x changshan-huyou]|uniref:Large ribosomal subunit protein uL4m n=1 Tax=Citrus x changshan-huyou TaxID=2935761 RepID=A0AAP0MY62_9ROSI
MPSASSDAIDRNGSSEEDFDVNIDFIDPQAEDQELKGQLLRRYSGCLSSLKQEFMKKRKKGKLPKEARQQLLDWWSKHYKWPYPSESQKLALAESTGLDSKQINNWFINQRKRHWKPSEDMQFMVMDATQPQYYIDSTVMVAVNSPSSSDGLVSIIQFRTLKTSKFYMALTFSRRLLRRFGSFSAFGRYESPSLTSRSIRSPPDLYVACSGDNLFPLKSGLSFLASRKFSTTILTPDSSEGAFPSDLLLKKTVLTPDITIGLHQDLVIPVTNFFNEDKGFMVLAGDVFDVPIRKDIIHRVVRWQLAKRQQGTHSTKTISEVSGTGKKPWRQKGTGRARHGTLRGPQFRGGATMHGPKPRSHAIKLNKKVRRLGLKIALSARAAEGKLLVFEDLEVPSHKTKFIVNYYNQMENTKKVLLCDGGCIHEKLKLAAQNLHYVNVLPSVGLNVYSILQHDTLVMSRDAVNKIVDRMHTPINR